MDVDDDDVFAPVESNVNADCVPIIICLPTTINFKRSSRPLVCFLDPGSDYSTHQESFAFGVEPFDTPEARSFDGSTSITKSCVFASNEVSRVLSYSTCSEDCGACVARECIRYFFLKKRQPLQGLVVRWRQWRRLGYWNDFWFYFKAELCFEIKTDFFRVSAEGPSISLLFGT